MSSSDGGEQQQHDEHHVAVAAALQRARDAVVALAEPSLTFLDGMRSALQQAEAALQQQPRGRWAWTLPNRTRHLASMLADDPRRPAREEAYAAMANLKAVAFAAASSTDRSRKSIINKRQKTTVDDSAAAAAGDGRDAASASACAPFARAFSPHALAIALALLACSAALATPSRGSSHAAQPPPRALSPDALAMALAPLA
jgi:hypothetical protein